MTVSLYVWSGFFPPSTVGACFHAQDDIMFLILIKSSLMHRMRNLFVVQTAKIARGHRGPRRGFHVVDVMHLRWTHTTSAGPAVVMHTRSTTCIRHGPTLELTAKVSA